MKEINFRIIELENYQMLLEKDFDEEEEMEQLKIIVYIKGLRIEQKHSYDDEKLRDKVFEEYTDAQAQEMINALKKMLL